MTSSLRNIVGRIPASIRTKLLLAFLAMALLLLIAGAVGLGGLAEVNRQADNLVALQRKIAAYHQLQHDTTGQLYSVSLAIVRPTPETLESTLRQLNEYGYDLDRLQFVARDEIELLKKVKDDHEKLVNVVTRVVELLRGGKPEAGIDLQLSEASPLADRLERLTNELVNRADADMVGAIEESHSVFGSAQKMILATSLLSVLLALGLGYAISVSIVDPVTNIESRMTEIASGHFAGTLAVTNRDELGALTGHLNRMSEELGRLYEQVETARQRAERNSRDKSRFLAAASHDLRQPIHALVVWVENMQVALGRDDREAALKAANIVSKSCQAMSASFNAILDLSNLDAQDTRPAVVEVDLDDLLERIATDFEPMAREKGLRLRRYASRGPRRFVWSDPSLLGRAVRNLVSNAIKYTESGGLVLGAVPIGTRARIDVRDSGVGIPEEFHEDIFEEFFQIGNRERDRSKGLGLGLAIVRRCVQMLEGHALTFHSSVGHGSRFSVSAPLSEREFEVQEAIDLSQAGGRVRGAYIVVVDDERNVLDGIVEMLQSWGCVVEGARTGVEAFARIDANERIPDLLISDLRLVGAETGVEVASSLRKRLSIPLPVVILTGEPVNTVALEAADGPTVLVHKPIAPARLRQILEDMLPERVLV